MELERPLFCIIDASGFIFRAYYAVRPLSNKQGLPTNAIFGFANMILGVIDELKPEYIAVVYDTKHPSFRKEIFPEYKANRGAMPEDLAPQIPYIKKFVEALGLPAFEQPGYEADDLIATLAVEAAAKNKKSAKGEKASVCIVSSDKDLMQLVSDDIFLYDTLKQKWIDRAAVEEKLGVKPEQVADYLGLMGDSSDNIPGVPGVGPKTAADLIREFGSINGIYQRLDEIKKTAQKEKLAANKEMALLSRELATVKSDLALNKHWNELACQPVYGENFLSLLDELDFQALKKKVLNKAATGGVGAAENIGANTAKEKNSAPAQDLGPQGDEVAACEAEYICIQTLPDLRAAFASLQGVKEIALDTETTGLSLVEDRVVGFSFSGERKQAYYVPVRHENALGGLLQEQVQAETAFAALNEFIRGKKILAQNGKFDANMLRKEGVVIAPEQWAFDTMIAAYVLAPEGRHNLDVLAEVHLGHKNITYSQVCGEGRNEVGFARADLSLAAKYAAEDAHVVLLLTEKLRSHLQSTPDLQKVFQEVDLPLLPVLAAMEWEGVRIDRALLNNMSAEFGKELANLEKAAHQEAGEDFNLSSPKQLQHILFEKLQLPTGRKTKTGYSTDVDVLANLSHQHRLPALILEYRELAKLKSTYVDVLPALADRQSDRVHGSFHQTVAATGRLSSSDPNLQNIPIRTENGRRIRSAFISRPGWKLIGADYSQIELRILAQMSGDAELQRAFAQGADIHALTASQVFSVALEKVSTDQRRQAKAINFGILYGKTAFSLAEELGIGRIEAADIIQRYFARFPTIKEFIDNLIKQAAASGYAQTWFGRRRKIDNINSQNKILRGMAERMAVNTPIQGTAADVIKIAMIRLEKQLRKFQSRLILQVHDELLVEAPESELEAVSKLMRATMEGSGHLSGFPPITVPLTVDLNVAENWLKL